MKLIFFGTPEAAEPYLKALLKAKGVEVVAAVTQPDKPSSRGQKVAKSPVKILAEKSSLPVLQPATLKDGTFAEDLKKFNADAAIVVAYGRILPQAVIDLFPRGVYNIHFSLLPQLRGAAPIQHAILQGLEKTGVSSFRIEAGLDTGAVLVQKSLDIDPQDNTDTLEEKLVALGLSVLEDTLKKIKKDDTKGAPQIGTVTLAPPLKKEDAKINWQTPAVDIHRQIRATIRMGAQTQLPNGRLLKILQAEVCEDFSNKPGTNGDHVKDIYEFEPGEGQEESPETPPETPKGPHTPLPGALCGIDKGRGFYVKCLVGTLLVFKVQAEGKKAMNAWSFWQGARLSIGDFLK